MTAIPLTDLAPDEAAGWLVARQSAHDGWLDAFTESLERRRGGRELARILHVWQVSRAEAGRMFGVSRQAVTKWLDDGVPSDRTARVADLAAATDLLTHHLKRERIPAVVRRPAPALGERSLLDLWAAGETSRVLHACREMFAFGDAHA